MRNGEAWQAPGGERWVEIVRSVIAAALLCSLAVPALAVPEDYFGIWEIGLGSSVSTVTSTVEVDKFWEKEISKTTIGPGHANLGYLYIKPDGTYQLRWYYNEAFYKAPMVTGRWTDGTTIKAFEDMKPITLIGAKPDPNGDDLRRNWVVGRNDEGTVQAIEDGYSRVTMKRLAGGAPGSSGPSALQPDPQSVPPPGNTGALKVDDVPPVQPPLPTSPIPSSTGGTLGNTPPTPAAWTPDALRQFFKGKTKAEIDAILGVPVKTSGDDASYNDVDQIFPPCRDCNYKSFLFRFTGPGGTVTDQFPAIQYWRVE